MFCSVKLCVSIFDPLHLLLKSIHNNVLSRHFILKKIQKQESKNSHKSEIVNSDSRRKCFFCVNIASNVVRGAVKK